MSDAPSSAARRINEILSRYPRGDAGSLVNVLHDLQAEFRYLSEDTLRQAAQYLRLPRAQVFGVATFYHGFHTEPRGEHTCTVCMGTACHVRGSMQVLDRLESKLDIQAGETTRDHVFTLETVNCLGACALGPIVVTDGEYSGQMTIQKADHLLKTILRSETDK